MDLPKFIVSSSAAPLQRGLLQRATFQHPARHMDVITDTSIKLNLAYRKLGPMFEAKSKSWLL